MARHILLVSCFLFCFATLTFAQTPADPIVKTEAAVTFSITGAISLKDTPTSILSLPVFQRLAEEKQLTKLSIDDEGNETWSAGRYSVQLVFKDMNSFSEWYNSPSTRQLFTLLKNLKGGYTSNLTMTRLALGRLPEEK